MSILRRIIFILAACSSANAYAVAPKPELPDLKASTTLGVVDVESDGKLSAVNIRFTDKPGWTEPQALEDHGTFLQLQLPNTIVPEPGKFFDGAGPIVKKIAVFQLTPTTAGVRMFVDKDAAKVRQASAAELLDKRVVVTIDQEKLDALYAAETAASLQTPELSAEQVIASVKVDRGIAAPADALKGAAVPAFKIGGLDLRSKLIQVSLFSGAMLLLMAMAFMMKPLMKRRRAKIGGEPVIDMKMLASLALAPRQKLSVIQVGDEKILIGITPENVSFISVIGAKAVPAMSHSSMPRSFSGLLAAGREEAPVAAPKLKDIPGNDVESLRSDGPAAPSAPAPAKKVRPEMVAPKPVARAAAAAAPVPVKRSTGRLNIAVGDDGAKRLDEPGPAKAIDDVTRMIREKLRNIGSNS